MVFTSRPATFTRRRRAAVTTVAMERIDAPRWRSRRWSRSRRRLLGSLAASVMVHGGTIALAWWLGNSGYFSARPLEVDRGRSSIALTASLAATEASRQPSEAPRHVAIIADKPRQAAVEQELGSPEPRVKPVTRKPNIDVPRPELLAADADLPQADEIALVELQPAVQLGGQRDGDAVLAQSPQAINSSDVPRKQTEAAVDSSASIPSPASAASRGADSDQPARIVFNPAPAYPPDALAARQTGRVVVRATISAQGTVKAVRLHQSSGVASLDAAALAAVRNWRFQPAMLQGVPVERDIAVPVRFTLAGR